MGKSVTMVGALLGTALTSVAVVVALKLFLHSEKQGKAYGVMMVRLRHDRRVRALAHQAAMLIQLKYRIYLWRIRAADIPPIFVRLNCQSTLLYRVRAFRHRRHQFPVNEVGGIEKLVAQVESGALQAKRETLDKIISFRKNQLWLSGLSCEVEEQEALSYTLAKNAQLLCEGVQFRLLPKPATQQVKTQTLQESAPLYRQVDVQCQNLTQEQTLLLNT
jgi:hypothetical protein